MASAGAITATSANPRLITTGLGDPPEWYRYKVKNPGEGVREPRLQMRDDDSRTYGRMKYFSRDLPIHLLDRSDWGGSWAIFPFLFYLL